MTPGSEPDATPPRRRAVRRRRRGRAVGTAAAVVLLLLVVAVAWFGYDAYRARAALSDARGDVTVLQEQVRAGSADEAETTLARLQDRTGRAHDLTDGALWRLAEHLPWVGADVAAVRTVAEVVDDLARTCLPGLLQATRSVDPAALAPVEGRVDLAPLLAVAPQVVAGDAVVQDAVARLDAVDTDVLMEAVADPVSQVRDQLGQIAGTTASAARAVELIPAMLGADGPRDYLVLVQNNAELRATGGVPGAVLLVRAQDGGIEILEQRAGSGLVVDGDPVLPLSDAEQALFGPDLGTDMRDVTFTPDFPRAAALARGIWQHEVGGAIDGVLAVDPGAVAHLLGATGPVALADGAVITADDAVEMLLSTVYLQIADPDAQDAFFAATATAVFGAVAGGQGDASAVVDALAQSAREGRLLLWSEHEDEQERIAGTVLSGELRGSDGGTPVIGVYLNDGTQAKLDYYLETQVQATTTCAADGARTTELAVTLTSTAPADAAEVLPQYVLGSDGIVRTGESRTNVLIYAPTGGGVADVRIDGVEVGGFGNNHDKLPVIARTITLKPGQIVQMTAVVTSGPGQGDPPSIRVTPTARGADVSASTVECDK